ITPAHDPNDFDVGKRHNLEFINILTNEGLINNNNLFSYLATMLMDYDDQ
ncbi:hypothetical protein MKX03_013635, partial [Papaver bracteatum]